MLAYICEYGQLISVRKANTFGDRALQTWVEDVPREEGQNVGLPLILLPLLVLSADGNESWQSTDRLCTRGVEMIDIIVMDESKIWR